MTLAYWFPGRNDFCGKIFLMVNPFFTKVWQNYHGGKKYVFSLKENLKNMRHTFWVHANRSTMQQNFYPKNLELFELTLKKCVYYVFTEIIYSAWSPMKVVVFCKNVLIL